MANSSWLFTLLMWVVAAGLNGQGAAEHGGGGRETFVLQDAESVVRTDAGSMRVVKGASGGFANHPPLHLGFITMEPNSLFVPQYLDASLILFVRKGEARIGSIYDDDFVENSLKTGDLYRIEAGSAFYLVNTAEGQRLQIIAGIDTSESLNSDDIQSFFIGGGSHPASVLSGFDGQTLATAMNISEGDVGELLHSQRGGAIVYLSPDAHSPTKPSVWNHFLDQGKPERRAYLRRILPSGTRAERDDPKWSFRNLLGSMFGKTNNKEGSLGSYNIYNKNPNFRNSYGWSTEVRGSDYGPLNQSDIGVYIVNLTAGSMMAPHVNPRATEYGVVLSGSGSVQVVYPNGTLAMDAEVREGDVFWVPRYLVFSQVASRMGPFVFFGFSTSARDNRPQFLVGRYSVFRTMMGPELAAAFGVTEDRLRRIVEAQNEAIILPAATASPGGDERLPEVSATLTERLESI